MPAGGRGLEPHHLLAANARGAGPLSTALVARQVVDSNLAKNHGDHYHDVHEAAAAT